MGACLFYQPLLKRVAILVRAGASLIGDDDDPVKDAHLGPYTRRVAGIVEQEAALAQVAHRGNGWQRGKLL